MSEVSSENSCQAGLQARPPPSVMATASIAGSLCTHCEGDTQELAHLFSGVTQRGQRFGNPFPWPGGRGAQDTGRSAGDREG